MVISTSRVKYAKRNKSMAETPKKRYMAVMSAPDDMYIIYARTGAQYEVGIKRMWRWAKSSADAHAKFMKATRRENRHLLSMEEVPFTPKAKTPRAKSKKKDTKKGTQVRLL